MTEDDANKLFHALASETRRRILDHLRDEPGQPVGELARKFDVSRIAVMNHLSVLEQSGLLVSERHGRQRKLYLNVTPIQLIHDRWLNDYTAHWASRLTDLKASVEQSEPNDIEEDLHERELERQRKSDL
jgi:predicted transcriptional regulator